MSERQTLRIDSIAHGGDGIGTLSSGKRAFVPQTVPGDLVEMEPVERRPSFERGRLLRVLEAGPERVEPRCEHAAACGGCQLQQLSAAGQLAAKERTFYDALARVGGIPREAIGDAGPILPSPKPFRYRIRCRLHVVGNRLGYHRRGTHDLVPIHACHLLETPLEALALRLSAHLRERPIPHLAAVELCIGQDGSGAAALEPTRRAPAAWGEGAEALLEIPGIRGVVVLPARRGRAPRLVGEPVVARPAPGVPDLPLFLRPDVFAQANAAANETLVREAVDALSLQKGDEVLELFAGAGNFTFALAARGARVTAVELEGSALGLARRAVSETPLAERIAFVPGEVRREVERLVSEGRRFDHLLLDPPRTGAKEVVPEIARLGPRHIAYVSCDPATLARDLRILVAEGYRLVSAQPIDMFPQTYHVEGVILLEKR